MAYSKVENLLNFFQSTWRKFRWHLYVCEYLSKEKGWILMLTCILHEEGGFYACNKHKIPPLLLRSSTKP
jgi:hypothetical protein